MGQFLLPGFKPVMELLQARPEQISKIYCHKNRDKNSQLSILCQKLGIPVKYLSEQELDRLASGNVSHQGLIAQLSAAKFVPLPDLLNEMANAPLPLVLALDQIQDTGNLGAIARTAYALGCAGIIIPRHNTAAITPQALRASAGALSQLPVVQTVNLGKALDQAEECGLNIYGAKALPSEPSKQFANAFEFIWHLPAILVLGNENKGIRPGVAKRCHHFISIPLARKFDSLNIAQSAAILMALVCKQRCNAN